VAAGESFILIDGETFGGTVGAGRLRLPFLEKDGRYWGTASDDQHAITELERLRATGARFLAVAWPGFWWLEH
jgi:hypothetical protein